MPPGPMLGSPRSVGAICRLAYLAAVEHRMRKLIYCGRRASMSLSNIWLGWG